MSINSYKLVPVKMFDDLIEYRHTPVECDRSITSIVEDSRNNISNDQSSVKYSTPCGPQISVGEGGDGASPMWVYEDQSILPNYSQGKKVTESLESYKNILDNNDVPEHVKIQLLQFFRDRYDKARVPHDDSPQLEEGDPNAIIHSILDSMGGDKRNRAQHIITILNNNNLVKWNSMGDFILPRYATINLRSLLRTLVYANVGSEREIQATVEIIKPFYKYIKQHIVNRAVITRLDNIHNIVSQKYLSLESPQKRKKKKK